MSETLAEYMDAKAEVKRLARRRALTIALVVALVSLTILSAVLYVRMVDYHDAKYRSQYVIMNDIEAYTAWASLEIPKMVDANSSMLDRLIAGTSATDYLRQAESMTYAIQEMYLDDSEKDATFGGMREAISAVLSFAYNYYAILSLNITTNLTDWERKLSMEPPVLLGLSRAIGAGFKSDVDFEEHPYSVVANLDLKLIRDLSEMMILYLH